MNLFASLSKRSAGMQAAEPAAGFEPRLYDEIPATAAELPPPAPGVRHLFVGHGFGVSSPDAFYVSERPED